MRPWFGFPVVHPPCSDSYLCFVETPTESGLSRKDLKVVYWSQYDGGWKIRDSIVRYWQTLPEPPEGGDAE